MWYGTLQLCLMMCGAEYFRVTINVTSTRYSAVLANRSSVEFQQLADAVRRQVEYVYRHVDGQQSVHVLQFRSL